MFASITLGNGGAFIHQDNLEQDKEEMFRVIGRFIQNKPLWIGKKFPIDSCVSEISCGRINRKVHNKMNASPYLPFASRAKEYPDIFHSQMNESFQTSYTSRHIIIPMYLQLYDRRLISN